MRDDDATDDARRRARGTHERSFVDERPREPVSTTVDARRRVSPRRPTGGPSTPFVDGRPSPVAGSRGATHRPRQTRAVASASRSTPAPWRASDERRPRPMTRARSNSRASRCRRRRRRAPSRGSARRTEPRCDDTAIVSARERGRWRASARRCARRTRGWRASSRTRGGCSPRCVDGTGSTTAIERRARTGR